MVQEYTTSEKFNPFPGLRPFLLEESRFFFGREIESEEIARKLIQNRFVAVTGASGAGKSSLINCGLIPKLTSSSVRTETWNIISFSPGSNALESLAHSLSGYHQEEVNKDKTGEIYRGIYQLLEEKSGTIIDALERLPFKQEDKILLIIDQFEELFRYDSPGRDKERERFLNLLTNTITGNNQNLFIAIAIHSDYISECAYSKGFTRLINNSNFFVPRMNNENLREVIYGPIKKAGAGIDTDLVEILIDDIHDRTDQLPVLQHTMMRTWARWKELDEPERPLSYSDYDSIGTVMNSISNHADELFEELSRDARIICEKLFKFITKKSPGSRGVRFPAKAGTIKSSLNCTEAELFEVIGKFRSPVISVLTPLWNVPLNDESFIDISYGILINSWKRLKKWVDEEFESVQIYLRLSEASSLYQQGKKGLLKQPDLQVALNWRDQNKPTLVWAQKYDPAFERAMVYLRTSEKEYLDAEERKIRQQKRNFKRIRILSSIFGSIAIITALSLGAVSLAKVSSDKKRKEAEKQKDEIIVQKDAADQYAALAMKKLIEADSNAAVSSFREQEERKLRILTEKMIRSTEMALAEARIKQSALSRQSDSFRLAGMTAEEKAEAALLKQTETQRLRMISIARSMALRSLQVSGQQDLQSLLAYQAYLFNRNNKGSANDADIYHGLYDVAKQYGNINYKTFACHDGNVRDIAFSPGSREFYTSGTDGKILKWDLDDPQQSYRIIYSGSEIMDVLAVSPGADWLACGGESAVIRMIPINGSNAAYELKGHSGAVRSLVFSYDGKYLYSAALDGKVLKWDLAFRTSTELGTDMMHITSVDLSANGTFLAGVSRDGNALVWDPERNTDKFRIEAPGKYIKTIKFKPGDEIIAVGYNDGMIEMWDLTRRMKVSEIKAHNGDVSNIRFSNKNMQMATAGGDGTLKLWDSNNLTALPVSFNDNGGMVFTMEFSPDGEVIISGCAETGNNLVRRPAYADTFAADGCSYVSRNFTYEEWLAYVGKDIEYQKTCPESDYKIKVREIR